MLRVTPSSSSIAPSNSEQLCVMDELHSSHPLMFHIDTNEMSDVSRDSTVGTAVDCRGRSDPLVDGSNPPSPDNAPSSSSIAPSSSEKLCNCSEYL